MGMDYYACGGCGEMGPGNWDHERCANCSEVIFECCWDEMRDLHGEGVDPDTLDTEGNLYPDYKEGGEYEGAHIVPKFCNSCTPKKRMIFVHLDDWIGCYVDGNLVDEAHSMSIGDAALIMIKHNVSPKEMEDRDATDEFMQEVQEIGNLPQKLSECKLEE